MSLSAFIRDHKEPIIVEFAAFARTLMPTGADLSDAELRDHADDILTAVVHDLGTPQTVEEQSRRSKGHGSAHTMAASGKLHADHRIQHGFGVRSVLAESAHGGEISVRSSSDQGTTFTVRLPKLDSTDSAPTASATR